MFYVSGIEWRVEEIVMADSGRDSDGRQRKRGRGREIGLN